MKKTLTLAGEKFTVTKQSFSDRLFVSGPRLVAGAYLPAGVTLSSSDLRQQVAAAVAQQRQRARQAAEGVRFALVRSEEGMRDEG
jgi:hypothetical protein